ncbi:MAG: hypothetical protein JWP11_3109 [Frankiales bacterium]|nr:hypothetical protein [Frankiales bacterium]
MKFSRTRLLLVAVAAPVALVAATTAPASAASAGVAVVTGTGSISPGLTAVPSGQSFSFGGTALVTGVVNSAPEAAVSHSISASGSDLAGSYAEGAGTLNVNISGLPSMGGVFVRIGAVVLVAVTGPVASAGAGVCGFVAAQLPPATVTDYTVACGSLALSTT